MNIKNSKYAYNVFLQKKKDESQRFCGDYRPITCNLKRIHYLMPWWMMGVANYDGSFLIDIPLFKSPC
jgi:hypothetical protein